MVFIYRIISVKPEPDYKLQIDFDDGSRIIYNMQNLVKSIPYNKLSDWEFFRQVYFDERSVFWEAQVSRSEYFPLRLSIDEILFSLRG